MVAANVASSAGFGSCDQKKQFLEFSSENLRMKARLPGICCEEEWEEGWVDEDK